MIREKRITSQALTEAYLDRLEKYGKKLGAVVTIARDAAIEAAQVLDREISAGSYRGPLHGIPYGVKDLLATRGIPTTWGAKPYKNRILDYDATIIKKLREAGAVLIAKLAMVELAGGLGYNSADASFTGPGRTPWNRNFWAGGSSAGSAAATAAGLVAFSIGSETSGSIICPSAFCGASGLRPTYGRVSRHGAMALCWTLDKLGPICRSADDCGLVLAAIAGHDPLDQSSMTKSFKYPESASEKKFKLGIIKGSFEQTQADLKKNFLASIEVLKQFAVIDEAVPFPDYPYDQVIELIINAEGASAFRDLIESGQVAQLQDPSDRIGGYVASMTLAVDYLQAMRLREPIKRDLDKLYAKYDALLAPSMPSVALPIEIDFDKAYPGVDQGVAIVGAGNAAGMPALSVPNGFGENRLPTGIQFTGRAGSEARLITLASLYQKVTDWHKQRPNL